LAQNSDIIVTMLPDSPDVEQVVDPARGVLEGIESGRVVYRYVDHCAHYGPKHLPA
jgi:3-hydroxyisobutyrate dehydrogenase-like beta-hydroxyacid dehydrogenase